MNILSSPLWPSDMPDDRRVIALLGLVQISEEGMSLVQAVEQMEEEIERLNALVSMQAGALEMALMDIDSNEWVDTAKEALSATSETVSDYQNKVKAKALEEMAEKLLLDEATCEDEVVSNHLCWASVWLRNRASELRAKGE